MMEIKILETLFQSVDIVYIIMCNVCTYTILQFLKEFQLKFDKGQKRIISSLIAIVLGVIFTMCFYHNPESVFYGFFIQFLTWDYFFKPFIETLLNKTKGDK